MDQAKAFGSLISSAREWAKARSKYRRAVDSRRSTPRSVEDARQVCIKLAADLETCIRVFDEVVKMPYARKKRNINWAELAGAVAKIAGGVEQAVKGRTPLRAEVIDTKGEPV